MSYQQDFKQLLQLYTINGNLDAPLYHCQQDSVQLPCNYYCSLVVCGQTYSTTYAYQSKGIAESKAAKLACEQLNLLPDYTSDNQSSPSFVSDNQYDNFYTQKSQNEPYAANAVAHKAVQPKQYSNNNRTNPYTTPQKFKQTNNASSSDNLDTPVKSKQQNPNIQKLRYKLKSLPVDTSLKVVDSSPIPVSSINDVWKYMHGDVLANAMKSIAAFVAQEENIRLPRYESEKLDRTIQGTNVYKGQCTLKDQVFQSLGKNFYKNLHDS